MLFAASGQRGKEETNRMAPDLEQRMREAAAVIIEAGAREVYVFGSAARGAMDDESDVDLAVAGLPPERFFRAVGKARRILKRPVDLVDLDEHTPFCGVSQERKGLAACGMS